MNEASLPQREACFIPSGLQGRSPLEAQESIPHSAECGKGYAPLTVPPFEKGGRKLSVFSGFNKNRFAILGLFDCLKKICVRDDVIDVLDAAELDKIWLSVLRAVAEKDLCV